MDISVRRLNHRLALQLPKELPLGLVFVTGVVDTVNELPTEDGPSNRTRRIEFDLVEEDYILRCVLTQSTSNPTTVWEGEKVRVGGHLVFDPLRANYFLTTHDVEIIFDFEEGKNYITSADRQKIYRVCQNLIFNAVKYNNNKGQVKVSLKASKNNIQVDIKDDGEGRPTRPESRSKSKIGALAG